MEQRDDSYYIGKVLSGDTSAYAVLVDRYKTMAFNISLRILGSREDAEEVAQDSFVKAFRSLGSFRGSARFSTWLFRIVYNSSVSHYRKRKREIVSDQGEAVVMKYAGLTEEGDAEANEAMVLALREALSTLPEEEQAMITLYYYQDSSIDDIAAIARMTPSNVKVRLHRARKKLHELISRQVADEARA
ncbi:MAG: sigma-70 family RNA polymerase sigma factor [Marinilabiliales bacterium]|nr:MAG: sigma-70 family RNA polymerase sigma factor [Marinilabiliales bacterium]